MKVKFYSIKSHLVTLLLLLGIGNTSFAQVLERTAEDIFLGATTQSGSAIRYTYTIYNDLAAPFSYVEILDIMPWGTTYVEESTEVNGVHWPDVNGTSPIVDPTWTGGVNYLPLPNGTGILNPGETATLTFLVTVDANAGSIKQYYGQIRLHFNAEQSYLTGFPFTTLPIVDDISCTVAYITNAGTADANTTPSNAAANSIISSINLSQGTRLTTVFNGTSINNYYANTNTRMPLGSRLLTDASAIAFDNATQRIYFVNNSTTAQQELYYVNVATSPAKAYKFSSTTPYYLNTNTGAGYNITRMTWAPWDGGVGYALTDNGQELIKFSVTGNVPTITNLGPILGYNSEDPNPVTNETGGDLCADYYGRLWLITNSGKLYTIFLEDVILSAYCYGVVNGLPTDKNNSLTIGPDGKMIVSGAYQNAYKIDVESLTATSITGGSTTNVFTSGDYASCYYSQFPWRKANEKPVADKPNTQEAILNAAVRVSPNPFVNSLNLKVALPAAESVKIRLIDMYGRTVYATTEKLSSGVNTVSLNIPGTLGRGIYVLDVWAGNKRLMTKKLSHL
jgi:uncharacterized repeat protein (TIGR01451 family)